MLINHDHGSRIVEPFVAAALIAVLPGLLRSTGGPRAFNGSPRVVGQVLLALHLTLFAAGISHNDWRLLTGSAVFGALIFLTSKFCVQAYLAIAATLMLFGPYRTEALVLGLTSWVLALLFSRGDALRILHGHIAHSRFYTNTLQAIFIERERPRFVRMVIAGAVGLRNLVLRGDAKALMQWISRERHPVFVLVVCFPVAVVGVAVIPHVANVLESVLAMWLAGMLAAFAVTSTRPFLFLGEAERYLEYGAAPAAVLSAMALASWPWWVSGACAFLLACIASVLVTEYVRSATALDRAQSDRTSGYALLNRLPPGVIWPIGSFHWQALQLSHHRVLTIGVNIDPGILDRETFMLVYGNYPYPSARHEDIIDRFGVNFIVSDPEHLQHYVKAIAPSAAGLLSRADIIFQSPRLTILALPALPERGSVHSAGAAARLPAKATV